MIPGSNLLARAARLIALQTVQYSAWASRALTNGVYVPVYAAAVPITGSVQAVPRQLFESLGLDLQKTYVMFYTSTALKDLQRDQTPHAIDFGGWRYAVESNTDWFAQDGWKGSILVRTGPTP